MSYQSVPNMNKDTDNVILEQTPASYGKLFVLGFFAFALCSFGPLSFFASVPLTMAILLYGRSKAFLMVSVVAIALFTVTINFNIGAYLGFIFLSAYFYSTLLGEVFLRKIHPVNGILYSGAIVILVTLVVIGGTLVAGVDITAVITETVSQTMEVIKQGNSEMLAQKGAEARMLEDLLNNKEMIVKKMIHWSPAAIFVSNFFVIWASMFILLRNSLLWRSKNAYPFTVKDLVNFKVPDIMVWPFILSLAITVGGEYVIGDIAQVIGGNLMYCLGIFYFFQGFGIYLDFLTFAKIQGFFRTLMVVFTISMAWRFVAVIGIFDFWVNFRKYFNKKTEDN